MSPMYNIIKLLILAPIPTPSKFYTRYSRFKITEYIFGVPSKLRQITVIYIGILSHWRNTGKVPWTFRGYFYFLPLGITTSTINALPQDHYFTETESIISTHAHDKPSRVLSKHAKHVCTTRCTYTVTQMLGYMWNGSDITDGCCFKHHTKREQLHMAANTAVSHQNTIVYSHPAPTNWDN